jgi:hypothetical protein
VRIIFGLRLRSKNLFALPAGGPVRAAPLALFFPAS